MQIQQILVDPVWPCNFVQLSKNVTHFLGGQKMTGLRPTKTPLTDLFGWWSRFDKLMKVRFQKCLQDVLLCVCVCGWKCRYPCGYMIWRPPAVGKVLQLWPGLLLTGPAVTHYKQNANRNSEKQQHQSATCYATHCSPVIPAEPVAIVWCLGADLRHLALVQTYATPPLLLEKPKQPWQISAHLSPQHNPEKKALFGENWTEAKLFQINSGANMEDNFQYWTHQVQIRGFYFYTFQQQPTISLDKDCCWEAEVPVKGCACVHVCDQIWLKAGPFL